MLHLGINITTTRIISEELALGNINNIKKSITKCILISLFFGTLASIIFFTNSSFIVEKCLHKKVGKSIVYLIAIAFPMISISSSISGYFTAVRKVYKSIIANFLEYLAKIIITIILLRNHLPYGNVENICYSLILGDVLSEIFSFTYNIFVFTFDSTLKKCTYQKKNTCHLYKILRILLPICFTSYIKSGLSSFKQLIIPSGLEKNGLNCTKALSEYGSINGMAMPIVIFPATCLNAISILIIPEISRLYIKKDYIKIKKYSKKILTYTLIFSILLSIVFFILGNKLGFIFYKDENIGNYIKILSFIIPFMYIDIIIDTILKGLDAQVSSMFINIADLLFSISFILFFIPKFGINGFIASIFFSEFLNFTLSLIKLKKLEKSF